MPLLLREAIGGTIRRARTERQRTLRDVSREARVSLGYLSEIERGRKEPSSELLASICEALALPLPDLLDDVAESMRPVRPVRPVATARARSRALAGPIDPALRSAVEEAFAPEPGDTDAGAAGPDEAVDPTEPGSDEPDPEIVDRADGRTPAGDAPGTGDVEEGLDADEGPDATGEAGGGAEATPTVRLVGLVTVSPAPVVYAA